jgi:hypothetical protein
LLSTEVGSQLYTLYAKSAPLVDAPPLPGKAPLTPEGRKATIAAAFENLGRQLAAARNISVPKATEEFLRTPTGKQLYAEMRAAA